MINLVIISNEEKVFDGSVEKINSITLNGPISILPNHQPYLTKIEDFISYETMPGTEKKLKISRGFLYTNGTNCFVVVDQSSS